MNTQKWMAEHTESLAGKTVAITGATGGLGTPLCRRLAELGARLILLDRNPEKSAALREKLCGEFPSLEIKTVPVNLEDMDSVRAACARLEAEPLDILIHNAGAYSIPRHKCTSGYDNVFQINFVSPYYMTKRLLPHLRRRPGARVVAVGSIAHNYSVSDPNDIDFTGRSRASKVYGNAKRYLMYALWELFRTEEDVRLSVCHPGVTFTNITAHYPKVIFALIRYPMKVIFPPPRKACLCILQGCFDSCGAREWIGPRWLNVWGSPRKRSVRTATEEEAKEIFARAEKIAAKLGV